MSHLKYITEQTQLMCLSPVGEYVLGEAIAWWYVGHKQIYLYTVILKQSLYVRIFMPYNSRTGDYLLKELLTISGNCWMYYLKMISECENILYTLQIKCIRL